MLGTLVMAVLSLCPAGALADRIVALVGDEVLTQHDLDLALAAARNEALGDLGIGPAGEVDEDALRAHALDNLIDDALVLAEAKKLDLTVDAADVDKHLARLKQANGWDDQKLERAVKEIGFPTLEAYRKHSERELLRSQVVGMKVESRIRVSDADVQEVLNRDYEGGKREPEARVLHVWLKLPDYATLEELRKAREDAGALRARILSGEMTFETAMGERGGGDTGFFPRGRLDPTFENAAFALERTGDVSAVVQSSRGFHILKLVEKRMGEVKDLEELRSRIRFEVHARSREKGYAQWLEELRRTYFIKKLL